MRARRVCVTIAVAAVTLCCTTMPASAATRDLPASHCKLTTPADRDVTLGFNREPNRVPSRGTVNVAVLLVDFSDQPATAAGRAQAVSTVAGVRSFLSSASYGRLTLQPTVVDQWLRMPRTAAAYSADDDGSYKAHKAYLKDAIDAADAKVDFSQAEAVVVLAGHDIDGVAGGAAFVPYAGDGIEADGKLIDNLVSVGTIRDGSDVRVLAHELLHTLGLPDLYAPHASVADPYPFTGPFDLMADVSAASPSPTAWEKWVLGWLDDSQVRCLGTGMSTISLTPIESVGGLKAAVVVISDSRAVVVESRSQSGIDASGPSGVIVYQVDLRRASGHGPVRLARWGGAVMSPLTPRESISLLGVRVMALTDGRVRVQVPGRPA